MAKALFGHVGVGTDVRIASELHRLRERVRCLEAEVSRLEALNAAMRQVDEEMLTISVPDTIEEHEPALT
jgi:hypothetical protein